jgi:hypothetical protein
MSYSTIRTTMSGTSSDVWRKVASVLQYGQDVGRRTRLSEPRIHFGEEIAQHFGNIILYQGTQDRRHFHMK